LPLFKVRASSTMVKGKYAGKPLIPLAKDSKKRYKSKEQ
jgi:hypothetical protein